MTTPAPDVAAYELRVQGHLDQHWSTWFDGFTITHQDDGTTILRGLVRDQSELHGLLAKVRDLGTALISVTPLGPPVATRSGPTQQPPGDRWR